jgi:hypothetical protein
VRATTSANRLAIATRRMNTAPYRSGRPLEPHPGAPNLGA